MKVAALLLLVSSTAFADESFESRAQGAKPVRDLESVAWAFTAACDRGDDVEQRQCRQVRNRAQQELDGPLVVTGDREALVVGKWNANKKSLPLTLKACIRCDGSIVAGKQLYDNAKAFPDEAAAVAFAKSVPGLRVELVVKVPAARRAKPFQLDVLAWRVVSPCDGTVVISEPVSAGVAADKSACKP